MARRLTQRELRNQSGEIMRALDRGEQFVVTRNGAPVGELRPVGRRTFVAVETATAAFQAAPVIDAARLREDVDVLLDQDLSPRV